MARRFIETDVWSDVLFDNFNKNERYFWLFLLTTRYGNISGCFEISKNQIAYETKLNINEIISLLNDFEYKYKLIYYCEETNEIFLLNWYKYNWSKSPKVETNILKVANNIKNTFFKETVLKMVEDFKVNDTVSIPYRYPSKSDTNTNSFNSLKNKEKNINNIYNIEQSKNNQIDTLFNDFWKAYPKKVGKAKCLSWFKSNKPKPETVEIMVEKIKDYKLTQQWQNEQYIPHPYTWLNQGRWEDELEIKNENSSEWERIKNKITSIGGN